MSHSRHWGWLIGMNALTLVACGGENPAQSGGGVKSEIRLEASPRKFGPVPEDPPKPGGHTLFALSSNCSSSTLEVVDVDSMQHRYDVKLPIACPSDFVVTPDGARAVVVDPQLHSFGNSSTLYHSVYIVDTQSGDLLGGTEIVGDAGTGSVALSPDGSTAYVGSIDFDNWESPR